MQWNHWPILPFQSNQARRWMIGLAPGSCGEGAAGALLAVDGVGLDLHAQVLHVLHTPYSSDLRRLLVEVATTELAGLKQLSWVHRLLGETLAQTVGQLVDQSRIPIHQLQCVGCSGHGVGQAPDSRFTASLELGMAAIVAERTGVTTVSDFRSRDVAAGGHGAPLEAIADYLLFRNSDEDRLLLHLGNVATVVFLPANARVHDVIGFEAGPCNRLLDSLMRQLTGGKECYDPGGKHAVQGRCLEPVLGRWLQHAYWRRRPPKCLSGSAFGDEFAAQAVQLAQENQWGLHDLLCTATHLVVQAVGLALQRFVPMLRPPRQIMLSGGGVHNGLLRRLLEQQFPESTLTLTDEGGVPADSRRAVAHGILAALTMDGVPGNIPATTGASGSRLLGNLTPGSSANWARCLAWMAQHLAATAGARA